MVRISLLWPLGSGYSATCVLCGEPSSGNICAMVSKLCTTLWNGIKGRVTTFLFLYRIPRIYDDGVTAYGIIIMLWEDRPNADNMAYQYLWVVMGLRRGGLDSGQVTSTSVTFLFPLLPPYLSWDSLYLVTSLFPLPPSSPEEAILIHIILRLLHAPMAVLGIFHLRF